MAVIARLILFVPIICALHRTEENEEIYKNHRTEENIEDIKDHVRQKRLSLGPLTELKLDPILKVGVNVPTNLGFDGDYDNTPDVSPVAVSMNERKSDAPFYFPRPKFLVHPRGVKVIVKDDGYSSVEIQGTLNVALESLDQEGVWTKVLRQNKNGKWVWKDKNLQLNIGDTIYFRLKIVKNGLEYIREGEEFTVRKYVDENGNPLEPSVSSSTAAPLPKPTKETCKASPTLVMGVNTICKNALIFSEDFDKNTIRELSNWLAENKFPEEPDYPFNVYMSEPTGVLGLQDRNLVITPLLLEDYKKDSSTVESLDLSNRCTGQIGTTECKRQASGAYILPPVITGKLTTKHKFNFKYGRVELRAKLPAGNWLLPEINLEPLQKVYGSHHYESGLMRIAFAKGNNVFAKKLYGGPVLSDTDPYRTSLLQQKIGLDNWNRDYHNYTLIWRPDGLQLLVDGEQYGAVVPGEGFHMAAKEQGVAHAGNWLTGSVMAPLDEMFYLSLGLRVGGIHDFPDDAEKPWRNRGNKAMLSFYNAKDTWQSTWYDPTLKVDYVRVYAL